VQNSPIPNQRTFTVSEVAKMLGVKPSTVRAWISRKELRAYKIGHRRYISQQQIADFYYHRKTGDYVDMTYANGPVIR
jgi:excisionase family DNA binding protein